MTAAGFGAADRVLKTGDTMSGTLAFTSAASPPLALASGTSGYVLTSDSSGNLTLGPVTGGSGTALTPTAKTGTYTAAAGEYVVCNATSASFTVTLPGTPADKTICGVKMTVTASGHTVSVAPGSTDAFNVTGGTTPLVLSLTGQGLLLQYSSGPGLWYVTSDDLPLGQLDARYTQLAGDLGNTTASPHVTGIQGSAVAAPSGGSTYYLNASGAWTVPAGSGGASLDTTDLPLALAATALHGTGSNGASCSDHVHPTTGVALLAGAAFTGNVSTTGNLSASGTFGVTGNATASAQLAVSKRITSGIVTLTYASPIAVDASLGNTFRVTLAGSTTQMGTPSNATDGQMILFEIMQDATGGRALTWSGAYIAGSTVTFPSSLSSAGSDIDVFGFKYYAANAVWRLLAVAQGFAS